MKVRPYSESDLAEVHAIQSRSPQAAQWRHEDYSKLALDPLAFILVAETEAPSCLAGFAVFRRVLDEAELLNLAVEPSLRRKGIGQQLLMAGMGELRAHGVLKVFLEVRASNQPAIDFYSAAGFTRQGRRRGYYHHPVEDALTLSCKLAAFLPDTSLRP